jgi:DNA-binding PadR family transcriptional regulator
MADLDEPTYWKSLINIGLSKFFILKILYEGPSYGYEILKKVADLTDGCCAPTVGTIYPILTRLTKDGYAKILKISNTEGGRQRKIYTLTPKGKKTYRGLLRLATMKPLYFSLVFMPGGTHTLSLWFYPCSFRFP